MHNHVTWVYQAKWVENVRSCMQHALYAQYHLSLAMSNSKCDWLSVERYVYIYICMPYTIYNSLLRKIVGVSDYFKSSKVVKTCNIITGSCRRSRYLPHGSDESRGHICMALIILAFKHKQAPGSFSLRAIPVGCMDLGDIIVIDYHSILAHDLETFLSNTERLIAKPHTTLT